MKLSVPIDRPAAEAYEFLCQPQNFARWASGLGGSLRRDGADWVAQTPAGPVPAATDASFAADADWVRRDLNAAKSLLESNGRTP